MKLKYAIVSSNSNPEYLDFWPYVAKAWRELIGLEPVLMYIDNELPPEEVYQYGEVVYYQSIPTLYLDIAQQAQCLRFMAAKQFDAPFILSDIDMLPISKKYYEDGANQIGEKGIVSFSSDIIKYRWYRTNPQYPICYLSGDPATFRDVLELGDMCYDDFLMKLSKLNLNRCTDQKFFYFQSLDHRDKIKHLERGWIDEKYAVGRLDKVIWPETDYVATDYIDCHLPRPLSKNKERCFELFNKLGL